MISNSALDLKLHRELLLCSEINCFTSTRNLPYKQQVQFGISEGFRSHSFNELMELYCVATRFFGAETNYIP